MGKLTAEMRRSSRSDTPDVHRISDSSTSSVETSFRELDDVFLQTQARIWLGEVLHTRFDEETTIVDLLADGELLFQVSKVVCKMLLMKCVEIKYSKAYVYERTAYGKGGGRYMPYSNVDSFLKICQILGLTGVDLFSPSDVVEKRDTRRVCMCIRSLSKKARMKHLNVPDFDIVTYTIAMPTDMVGWIRRSLEQSHCSSPSSIVCSRCVHSKGKYRQKNQAVDYVHEYDFPSEDSDDAESRTRALEFQSPASNTSSDAATQSRLYRENSPGGDSIVEDNCGTPENLFWLDVQNQHPDGSNSSPYRTNFSAESIESVNASAVTYGDYQFRSEHPISSSQTCFECQIDLNTNTSCTHQRQVKYLLDSSENGCHMDNDRRTCVSSLGYSSTNELDGMFLLDSKETRRKFCNNSLIWQQNFRNHSPHVMPSDFFINCSDMQEEFTNASVVSSYPVLRSRCITKDRNNNEAKLACNKIVSFPAKACESRVEDSCSGNVEGLKGSIDLYASKVHADDSILSDTLPISSMQHESGTSVLIQQGNFNGNCVQPDREPEQDIGEYKESDFVGLGSNCRSLEDKPESKLVDRNGDADGSVSCKAAELDCEDRSDVKDDFTGLSVHIPEFQNFKEINQCNCTLEVLVSKDSDNVLKVKQCLPSDFPAMDSNENHRNLSPLKRYNLVDMDPNFVKVYESGNAVEYFMPADHIMSGDAANQYFVRKNEDIDVTSFFLSTADCQSYIRAVQNHALLDAHSMNMPQEFSGALRTNTGEVMSKSMDPNSNENTLRTVYGNQLEDRVLVEQSDSHCNGFTLQDVIYESSIKAVSNGSNRHIVSSKCLRLHDSFTAHGCKHLTETLKDAAVINDCNLTDAIDIFNAMNEPKAMVKHLNCSSIPWACKNIEIGCVSENMVLMKVSVEESKQCINSLMGRLQQDPEAISEGQLQKMFPKKSSCHAFERCKDMQEVVVRVLEEEMVLKNGLTCCLSSTDEDMTGCNNIEKQMIYDEKSSVKSEEERYKGSPYAGGCCVSIGRAEEKWASKVKETMNGHLCASSPPNDMFCIIDRDHYKSSLVKQNDRNPLLVSISDHDQNQQHSDLSAPDNKLMPTGSTESGSETETESPELETEVEFYADFRQACLGIPHVSNRDQVMPKKAAFDSGHALEFVFADDSIHCNHIPRSSSIQLEDLSLPTLGTQSCSTPECSENTSDENESIGVKIDRYRMHIDGNQLQVHGTSMNHEEDVVATGDVKKEPEEPENDQSISNGLERKDSTDTVAQSWSNTKRLLKSVAGGMTLVGAVFILLRLRKRRGEEKFGREKIVEGFKKTVPPKISKRSEERLPAGKASTVYPGERLKFKE